MKAEELLEIIRNLITKTEAKETYWSKHESSQRSARDMFELRLVNNIVVIGEFDAVYGTTANRFTVHDKAGNELDECCLWSADYWDGSWGYQPEDEVERNKSLRKLYTLAKASFQEANDPLKRVLAEIQQQGLIGGSRQAD